MPLDRYSCIKPVFICTGIYWTKNWKPLESMQEFVLCHYHNKNFDIISVRLGFWYLHFICQDFSVLSVTALYIWHTGPLRHEWMYLLCQYGALSLTVLYEVAVFSLELFWLLYLLEFFWILSLTSSIFQPAPYPKFP